LYIVEQRANGDVQLSTTGEKPGKAAEDHPQRGRGGHDFQVNCFRV
jgi:hypothetical protein